MRKILFDNEDFNIWINKKADEILSKDKDDHLSNKEALILILKSQAYHASYINDEFETQVSALEKLVK